MYKIISGSKDKLFKNYFKYMLFFRTSSNNHGFLKNIKQHKQ